MATHSTFGCYLHTEHIDVVHSNWLVKWHMPALHYIFNNLFCVSVLCGHSHSTDQTATMKISKLLLVLEKFNFNIAVIFVESFGAAVSIPIFLAIGIKMKCIISLTWLTCVCKIIICSVVSVWSNSISVREYKCL